VTTLLLVRHGETDWNADGRLQGQTDRPLSDFGRRQARQLADELAGEELEAIYASDLSRARETAEIIGDRLGLATVLDPDLREKDWGTWEGLSAVERDRVEFVGSGGCRTASRWTRPRRDARRLDAPRSDRRPRAGAAGRRQLRSLGLRVGERLLPGTRLSQKVEDYTSKYKGEQVEVALFGGEYQEGVLTAYCYVDEVAHIELNGHILVPLQNIASLHCSSRCDAPQNEDWPPRGLLDDDGQEDAGEER